MINDAIVISPDEQPSTNALIMKSKNGGFIDLQNMNFQSIVVTLDADFRNRNSSDVKLDFQCNLYTNITTNGYIVLVFSLYRYRNEENFELLTSVPYTVILSEEVPEGGTPTNLTSEKNDFVTFSYFDNDVTAARYRYVVKAEINFINVVAAQIQSSTLSLIAQ